ncbi:MAG: hypothetical protein RBS40_13375 [Rhodocyclaceae bacterium]|jgi:hypothetical protein|nr:hypothetical protein [Rhodocyclaceae bacterium]
METLQLRIIGDSPILMHSDRLANPLDPLKKEMALYTGKRKKTDEDHEMIAFLEWKAAMYWDVKAGPYLPGRMLKSALIRGATKSKDGPKIKTGAVVLTDKAPLEYDGPRDQAALWGLGTWTDMRSVVVQRARLMRCRPIFPEWSARFEVVFDPAVIDQRDLLRIAETTGQMVGLGDYRVERGGDFGRFHVEVAA